MKTIVRVLVATFVASAVVGVLALAALAFGPPTATAQSREAPIGVKYMTEPMEGCTFVVFVFPNGDYEVFPTRMPCEPPPPPLRTNPPI